MKNDNDNYAVLDLYGVFKEAGTGILNAQPFTQGEPDDWRNRLVFERDHNVSLVDVVKAVDIPSAVWQVLSDEAIAADEAEAMDEYEAIQNGVADGVVVELFASKG